MNEIAPTNVPTALAGKWAELNALDTDALKCELGRVLGITAENLCRAAMIVSIMESRGEDLSRLKLGLIGYLRKIACGQVLPEVVAKFVGHPALKRIACLPVPDQERCLSSDLLPIGVIVNGKVDERTKPLLQMESHELRQVFAADHIRDASEQVSWLRSQEFKRPSFEAEVESPPYTIVGTSVVIHRPVKLARRDVRNILKALSSDRKAAVA